MGRGDNRRSWKMRRRKSQAKHKARLHRKRTQAQAHAKREPVGRTPQPTPPASPTPTAAPQRFVGAADLVAAVALLGQQHAIVWSNNVRDYFTANGLLTGERREDPTATRNGAHFERADHEACRLGELQKWKRGNTVGWSRSRTRDEGAYVRATEAAIASGAARLDYVGSRWTPMRYDAASGQWTD